MRTKIFENEKSGATIWKMDGVIYFKEAGAILNAFDLNNEADFAEFISDVIIGGGYTEGLVKTIREDSLGGCSFANAVNFFNETIKPILNQQ